MECAAVDVEAQRVGAILGVGPGRGSSEVPPRSSSSSLPLSSSFPLSRGDAFAFGTVHSAGDGSRSIPKHARARRVVRAIAVVAGAACKGESTQFQLLVDKRKGLRRWHAGSPSDSAQNKRTNAHGMHVPLRRRYTTI